ncbi:MAG: hypothetical protein JWM16_1294 [Verrucomicrobiales bacterium]|nr:hypothetical protein [Verrucomicrobiales bacterium]
MQNGSFQFEGLLETYFEAVLDENPLLATYVGLKTGEGRFGRNTLNTEIKREKRRQAALRKLESISPGELTNEQHLDRLALRSQLLRECEDFARGRHTMDPSAPEAVLNILLHELQRGEDEPKRAAKNLRSLLRLAPQFLDESFSQIDKPERVWVKILEQTTGGAETLYKAVETFLQKIDAQPADQERLNGLRRAVEKFKSKVKARPSAPEGSFSIGPVMLQRRIRDQLGLDYTLGEIETLALAEVDRVNGLLREACAKYGKNRSPEAIIEQARKDWKPKKPLLELYREETFRMAAAFKRAKAVTFPKGDELQVRPVPDFMRPLFPTAAYSSPGAFEKRQRGIFWVNDLSETKTAAADKLAEQQQHFGLSLTSAHEAYPGHHLQFVTANQHPRKWRRLFAHAVFYEGWTLWCEQMMVDLKIERSPWLRIQQLHDALWRCHRILVDLRLQTGRYTYNQAVRHMQKYLGFTKSRAEGDVNWYTASPSVPMSYWLGRLENERLRKRLMEGRGWSLQKFNDWLLSFGTLPQAWLEKYGLD